MISIFLNFIKKFFCCSKNTSGCDSNISGVAFQTIPYILKSFGYTSLFKRVQDGVSTKRISYFVMGSAEAFEEAETTEELSPQDSPHIIPEHSDPTSLSASANVDRSCVNKLGFPSVPLVLSILIEIKDILSEELPPHITVSAVIIEAFEYTIKHLSKLSSMRMAVEMITNQILENDSKSLIGAFEIIEDIFKKCPRAAAYQISAVNLIRTTCSSMRDASQSLKSRFLDAINENTQKLLQDPVYSLIPGVLELNGYSVSFEELKIKEEPLVTVVKELASMDCALKSKASTGSDPQANGAIIDGTRDPLSRPSGTTFEIPSSESSVATGMIPEALQPAVTTPVSHAAGSRISSVKSCDIVASQASSMENQMENTISEDELQILGSLGTGAFGVVLSANYCGKQVALKMLSSYLNEDSIKVFDSKVRTLMRCCKHENIVFFLGIFKSSSRSPVAQVGYLCELADMGSLFAYIENLRREMTGVHMLSFSKDIAAGMEYLISLDIVHRDLKSPNILIFSSHSTLPRAKICNFRLSRDVYQTIVVSTMQGSSCWMATENIEHQKVNKKTDVYSFGIVLWEMITRCTPYRGKILAFVSNVQCCKPWSTTPCS